MRIWTAYDIGWWVDYYKSRLVYFIEGTWVIADEDVADVAGGRGYAVTNLAEFMISEDV